MLSRKETKEELFIQASKWRQSLHEQPQTAFEEKFASNFVLQKLKDWDVTYEAGIAQTGIVASVEGKKNLSGKSIGLRGDMDALDILEKTGLPYASKIEGKMHACGHDGHTIGLLATVKAIKDDPNFDGIVHFIFQPAEERDSGALRMIEAGLFERYPCDYVFAIHNWPYIPVGTIALRDGPILAADDTLKITINGKGGHAAMPHNTVDPVVVATDLIQKLQNIVSRSVNPIDTAVISITNLNVGTGAYNIIPDTAELLGTVRTFSNSTRDLVRQRIQEVCRGIEQTYNAQINLEHTYNIAPTVNTPDGFKIALDAAQQTVGKEKTISNVEPNMGGEDFGTMLEHVPGAFAFVGQATESENSPHNQSLHSPFYDFNNEIIPIVVQYFTTRVKTAMPLE